MAHLKHEWFYVLQYFEAHEIIDFIKETCFYKQL